MASLVEQIFMQANAGSAKGQGLADYFATGAQIGQRQQQLRMQERELAAELSLVPLNQTLLQQEAEMNGYAILDYLEGRQQAIRNKRDMTSLRESFSKAFTETNDPFGTMRMLELDAILKNPFLPTDPEFKAFSDTLGRMAEESERLKRGALEQRRQELYDRSLDLQEKRLDNKEVNRELAETDKALIRTYEKQIEHLSKRKNELPNDEEHLSEKLNLQLEIGRLQQKIQKLGNPPAVGPTLPPVQQPATPQTPAQEPLDIGRFRVTPVP